MHYTCEIDIAVPRARVVELMTDGDRAAEWMPGLVEYTALEGERGKPGSVSRLRFDNTPGDGEMREQVETLSEREYRVVYLLGPVRNENLNTFDELPDGGTRWVADHVFHLPPGMLEGMGADGEASFRRNTQASMVTFKTWCEQNA